MGVEDLRDYISTSYNIMLPYKVNLDKVGLESADKAYGGYLDAYSFFETTFEDWIRAFKDLVLSKMGKEYFPIYRMADGEYRFAMGRRYNWHKKPLYREVIAVTAEKLHLKNPNKWQTSWGESYPPKKVKALRAQLIKNIAYISKKGMLACYYNTNGLHAFEEYNKTLLPFFTKHRITFNKSNYIPFHFVCSILVKEGWQDFIVDRHILIVTGSDADSEYKINSTLTKMGAKTVSFMRISKTASMEEELNLKPYKDAKLDIAFVAAGIGSANILRQLEPLQTVTLDIGGFMNCIVDHTQSQHGGVFKFPK